jgi:hypothetical protein
MEYYLGIFCISKPDLTDGDPSSDTIKNRPVMSEAALHIYLHRNPYVRMRNGGGPGRPALMNFEALRSDIKARVIEKYGDVHKFSISNHLIELIEPDLAAAKYFSEYLFDDSTNIKIQRQVEYNANATILNAVGKFVSISKGKSRSISSKRAKHWDKVSEAVNNLDKVKYPHSLPTNPIRLKEKFLNYQDHGYSHLIHKGHENSNARLVNDAVERLILSIYCQENLPFGSWVHDDYLQFIAGTKTIVDKETGAILDRDDYFDEKRGSYITISQTTVRNILNNPSNKLIIDRFRNNRIDHVTRMTPMNHRKPPEFSLSKISMDDRDLPRKTSDGKWVHTYMAFDVASQAVLSCVYSPDKPTIGLVWECFRELYRTISDNGMMWPAQVEVEHHLMKDIKEELNAMFPFVTFCEPGQPQSKRAEHFIRFKKYLVEKRTQVGVGRFYGKGAYKTIKKGKGEEFEHVMLPYDTLVDDDRRAVLDYNNQLHPNQKLFQGKTRWQVLLENMNPDLGRPQQYKLFRYLGLKRETSVRNNDFAMVQYGRYDIDLLSSISRLRPNNYNVEAYYLPDRNGSIGEVYLYQGDTFITKATKSEDYNEALIERTPDDERIRTEQAKRKSHYFKIEREGVQEKVTRKLEIIPSTNYDFDEMVTEIVTIPEQEIENIDELIESYKGWGEREAMKRL